MPDFVVTYAQVGLELARLLDVKFIPGEGAISGHTGAALTRVIDFHNQRDYQHRDWELGRLMLLIDDLHSLEHRRPELLAVFRSKLQDPDKHRYFGSRHELTLAVALIEKDIEFEFERPGKADFEVQVGAGTAGIECGSSHLSRMKSGDLMYKIRSVLREKSEKPYAGSEVALCLDATNLQGVSVFHSGKLLFGSASDAVIREEIAKTPFGSVVMMATVINKDLDPPEIQRTYSRFDNPGIAPPLALLFEELFPAKGEVEMVDYSIPPAP